MKCNFHTHNVLCDGKDTIETFVEQACEKKFDQLGFSSHAPVDFCNNFAIEESNIPQYFDEISKQQELHPEIELFTALECDFVPGMTHPFNYFADKYPFDYLIGGVHLVKDPNGNELWFIDGSKREIYDEGLEKLFQNDIQKAVTTFWEQTFEMIETQKFDIIAHFDKIKMHNQNRFFKEDEIWYKKLAEHAIQLIKQHQLIVEVNLRGVYKKRCEEFYPSNALLQKIAQAQIPVIISSDAHKAEELELFYNEALATVKEVGINHLVCRKNGQWTEYTI